MLAQAQKQITQLFQSRTGLAGFGKTTRQLFPQRIQSFAAIGWQDVEQLLNFFQDPQPFLWNGLLEFPEGLSHPAADMELADLVSELKFLRYNLGTG